MTALSRPRGRPPKARPEAAPALTEHEVRTAIASTLDPELTLKSAAAVERLIEVELTRKYAPAGQTTEIQQTVPPGTVMELPVREATRVLKMGWAHATNRTFGE